MVEAGFLSGMDAVAPPAKRGQPGASPAASTHPARACAELVFFFGRFVLDSPDQVRDFRRPNRRTANLTVAHEPSIRACSRRQAANLRQLSRTPRRWAVGQGAAEQAMAPENGRIGKLRNS